jgi:hypothetical protein
VHAHERSVMLDVKVIVVHPYLLASLCGQVDSCVVPTMLVPCIKLKLVFYGLMG